MNSEKKVAPPEVDDLVHDAPGPYGEGPWSESESSDRVPEGVRTDAFSESGLLRYLESVDSYARDLASLSQKIARRSNVGAAYPHHVARAGEALAAGRSRLGQGALVMGSLLLGGTITLVVGAFTGAQQAVMLLSVGVVAGVVGTVTLMYGLMR